MSWYLDDSQFVQMSGGSRMWQSASTTSYFDIAIPSFADVRVSLFGGGTRWRNGCWPDCASSTSAASRRRGRRGSWATSAPPSCGSFRPSGDVLRGNVARAWNAGKEVVALAADAPRPRRAARARPTSCSTPPARPARTSSIPPARPNAVWVSITPFGLDGPRASWRASDLGIMAASGNMYATGDPDRAPVRCTEPPAYAHTGGEAAFAALTALWSGTPQRVDVSMQEVVLVANMAAPANFPKTGIRGNRRGREHRPHARDLARARRLRVVRAARRQGPGREPRDADQARRRRRHPGRRAHEPGLDHVQPEHGDRRGARRDRDRGRRVLLPAHDARALRHRVRDEPHARARELAQGDLRVGAARVARLLRSGRRRRTVPAVVRRRAFRRRRGGAGPARGRWRPRRRPRYPRPARRRRRATKAWDGVHILEFGAGAAGPIATRYFSENGATVLRIESRTRPDFLRAMALAVPDNPHGLEGSPLYDGLNVGKRSLTLNLKQPAGVEHRAAARRRVGRRGRRELRAARDEELRARLRQRSPRSSPTS